MQLLMQIFYGVKAVPQQRPADRFNQWERRVVDLISSEPKTIREILTELGMNCSTVYRITERLEQRGVLCMVRVQRNGKKVKAYFLRKD